MTNRHWILLLGLSLAACGRDVEGTGTLESTQRVRSVEADQAGAGRASVSTHRGNYVTTPVGGATGTPGEREAGANRDGQSER